MSGAVAVGIVGCGRLAELGYAPAISIRPDVRLAAVADPDADRRELLAGDGVAAYATAGELIASGRAEALVVASPPATHEETATLAVEAGIPTLIEKPPAPDAGGAARIAALRPEPWIGFNRRFALGRDATGIVPAGGSIDLELRYRRFSWSPVSVRDPALIDLAPHLIDLALRAGIGPVSAVAAESPRPERITIELEGRAGSARLECACDRPHRERLEVRAGGGAVVERRQVGGVIRGIAQRFRRGPHPLVASLAAQLGELADAARGGRPSTLATAAEGAVVMSVVAAAAASLAHGGEPVAPEPVKAGRAG